MKIRLVRANYGSIPSEKNIAKLIENLNGSNFIKNEDSIILGSSKFSIERFDDGDPIHDTFLSTYNNQQIRIVKPLENYEYVFGKTITIASIYPYGFAIHFNIE